MKTNTPLPMAAQNGDLLPWMIEHGLSVTDDQRDILRGIIAERDRLAPVNADLLAALEGALLALEECANFTPTRTLPDSAVKDARAAIARAKSTA